MFNKSPGPVHCPCPIIVLLQQVLRTYFLPHRSNPSSAQRHQYGLRGQIGPRLTPAILDLSLKERRRRNTCLQPLLREKEQKRYTVGSESTSPPLGPPTPLPDLLLPPLHGQVTSCCG
jgi:hypothetical protein